MKKTIGLPRALFYWKKPHFWEVFFENLGFRVLLSPETNKEIVEQGVKTADTETCFSTKVLYGHILFLEGKVDLIFIPRLKRNESGLEYCPKFFGLPDLASILVKTPILSANLDLKKEDLETALIKLGKEIGKKENLIKGAIEESLRRERKEKEKSGKEYFKKIQSQKRKIVLVSHPYNLYDEYVNLRIKKKIEDLEGEVMFIDEVPIKNSKVNKIGIPQFHWEFGQEIFSQIDEIMKENIAGAIELSAFQCGCDAVLKEFVEEKFKKKKIPFLYLLIDEHTGEAGLQTRLEAFFDTLK